MIQDKTPSFNTPGFVNKNYLSPPVLHMHIHSQPSFRYLSPNISLC